VLCYLLMRTINRKNDSMSEWVAGAVADRLFRHLESHPHLIQSKRVEHILGLLSRLGENEWDWVAFTQLREPLRRYKWRYGLTLSSSGLRTSLFFGDDMSEEDEWEYGAVRFLLSLVPHHINRLRRCAYDGCQGWFFAAQREDQKFCKRGTCRQNHYDSTPEMREHKRLYMQKYRDDEKTCEERRKAQEGFRGRVKYRAKKSLR
jgi:hypothetical protein